MTAKEIQIYSRIHWLEYRYSKWTSTATKRDKETLKKIKENLTAWIIDYDEKTAHKMYKAQMAKKARYKKRLEEMQKAYEQLWFVTLTGDNKKIRKNFEKRLKTYAKKYLEENCKDYIANEDRGSKNSRYHIHAIVAWNNIHKKWDKGYMKAEKIRNTKKDNARIKNYVTKLVNHAGKATAMKCWNKKKGMKEVENLPF